MLKKLRKRVTVLFLIIAMVVGMLPAFPADTVKAANLIDEAEMTRRVQDLAVKLDLNGDLSISKGCFFTVDEKDCPNDLNSCSNCNVKKIIQSEKFRKRFGYNITVDMLPYHYVNNTIRVEGSTCCGFANFALWYLGKDDSTSNLFGETSVIRIVKKVKATKENIIAANLKIGDVICSGYTTKEYNKEGKLVDKNKYHSAVFLGYEPNGIKVLDSNWEDGIIGKTEIHVWGYNHGYFKNGNMSVARLKHYDPYASGPTISNATITDADTNGFTVNCTVTDPEGVDAVYFPNWTVKNGVDDIAPIWPIGAAQGNDRYSFRVNISEHNNEYGWYDIHVYARDKYGIQSGPLTISFDNSAYNPNPAPPSEEPSETPVEGGPTISKVTFSDADVNGFTVNCTVTDPDGVDAVYFPNWTINNGKDDLVSIWPMGTAQGNDRYSYRVNIAEHNNEYGVYDIHIYARDIYGNQSGPVTISFDNTAFNPAPPMDTIGPVISDVTFSDADKNGFTINCIVTDESGVGAVYFPNWTVKNGQDDLEPIWPMGTAQGNNKYSYRVNISEHNNEYGWYDAHIYARDIYGNQSGPITVSFDNSIYDPDWVEPPSSEEPSYEEDFEEPVITDVVISDADRTGYTITATATDNVEIIDILFPTRRADQTEDDWIWYEGTRNADGSYSKRIEISEFENKGGIYYTHVYAYDAGDNISDVWATEQYVDTSIPVASITLSSNELELGINQSQTLTATILPANASHSGLIWTTSNPNVATVTNGLVTAVGAGKATITVECGGKTATCEVNVVKPVSSISLNATSLNMFIDESIQLSVAYAPADASGSRELVWSTTNPAVAVVDSNGFVRTYSSGKAQIIVKLKNNESVTATCDVTVQSYIVSFDTRGGNIIPSIEYGKGRLLNVENPIREGYSFTGWYRDSACTDLWNMETDIVDRTMTLYAGWMEYPEGLWIVEIPEQQYTGKAIKPEVEVYHNADKLELGVDYSVSYKNNVNAADKKAGKAPTVTVTGKGNYSGKETATFTILSQSLNAEAVVIDNIYCPSNGKLQKKLPVVTWNGKKLKKDKDYTVSYPDTVDGAYVNVGIYKVVVTGKGNFSGTREIALQITGLNLISKVKTSKIANQIYTGTALEPEFTVKYGPITLTKGRDYEVRYENNISVGTADAIICGIGSYSGEKRVKFKIVGTPMNKVKVYNLPSVVAYDGTEKDSLSYDLQIAKNGITYKLVEGTDYTVTYKNNISVGTASVTFTGMNGYTGSLKKTFKITPYNIDADAMKAICVTDDFVAQYMKGATVIDPQVTFAGKLLINGKDYKLTFKNNKKVSGNVDLSKKPIVVITGKGNYSGSISYRFEIETQNISRLEMSATDKVFQNKAGKFASTPVIKDVNGKKLTAGTDYEKKATYTYSANTKLADGSIRLAGEVIGTGDIIPAGTSITAKVKGLGNYTGDIACTYRIVQADISKAKCSILTQTYTGKEIKLGKDDISVKIGGVKLAKEDYEIVSYSNNVNKGTATVVIKGVGNYGGTKTIKFKIKSKPFSWWFR